MSFGLPSSAVTMSRFLAAPQTQMDGQIGSKIRPALSADRPSAVICGSMKQRAVCGREIVDFVGGKFQPVRGNSRISTVPPASKVGLPANKKRA